MKSLLFALLVLGTPSVVFAQAVGSQDAVDALIAAQNQAIQDEMDWNRSKKLSLIVPVPAVPQPVQQESLDVRMLEKGQIGKLSYWGFKVAEVVDPQNLILILGSGLRIWVSGFPTDGLADKQSVRIIDYVEVTGSKSYQTVAGATVTIMAVKPLPKEESARRINDELEKAAAVAADQAKFRVWKSKDGKSTVTGQFVSYRNSKVTIEQKDGKRVTFAISVLTDEDREMVLKLNKEQRQADSKPSK